MINTSIKNEMIPMKKPSYPYLARGKGEIGCATTRTIFLITDNGEAVCLQSGDHHWHVGETTDCLAMNTITPLADNEVFTMSNSTD